jgi:RNA-binding protein YlmH
MKKGLADNVVGFKVTTDTEEARRVRVLVERRYLWGRRSTVRVAGLQIIDNSGSSSKNYVKNVMIERTRFPAQ